ncbi:MAG TPA: Rossmann-like and DUF2520 domain-containing protein [Bacteroidota bacterium]|nr:Rossmann-like and DUF2520 domain-containing protein [Bacteroidota bacterium]
MKPKKKPRAPLRVALIGAGRVGTVLGRVLFEEGGRITAVISRSRSSARTAASFLGCRRFSDDPGAIPRETDIVFIATPHDAVEGAAEALSRCEQLDFRRLAVCHASGMLTAAVLGPLALRGAAPFSFHPLQTFPRGFPPRRIVPSARGIWYGVDGPPAGLRCARKFARALKGDVIEIPPGARELYHAACVVASNHLTALLAVIREMYGSVRGEALPSLEAFRPIIESTIRNVFGSSPEEALSGPVARGGVDTVRKHFEAVRGATPELLPYFAQMTQETVRLALRKGSLAGERREALEQLVMSYTHAVPPSGNRT